MLVVLYEDVPNNTMLPLTHLQAAFDVRCGIFTARERARRAFPDARWLLVARDDVADALRERTQLRVNEDAEEPALFLSGSALFQRDDFDTIRGVIGGDAVFLAPDGSVAGYAASTGARAHALCAALREGALLADGGAPALTLAHAAMARRPWDLIARNADMLRADAEHFPVGTMNGMARIAESARLLAPGNVYIAPGARIGEGVVIDAGEGPVLIDTDAEIMHQAVLLGPAYIGPRTRVKIGAKIYGGTSAGEQCKLGGEIEGSIFHSFANKQHEGFVGHSYFAAWTNLGADTNTSDLKNTYGPVRMTLEGHEHDTGTMFLGTVMADHAKCGINTMFNTGTSVGVAANVFGGGYPPKYIPNFSWGGSDGLTEYAFDRCAAVAATVMARRGITFTDTERDLLHRVFERTAQQR